MGRWLLFLLLALPAVAEEKPRVPNLSLKDRQGNAADLETYRGKIIVLNFWATWCGPCKHEMPMLADAARTFASKNVIVIGVSIDDANTQPKVEPFVQKNKIDFPILVGAEPELLDSFGLGIAVPATAIIAPDGSIPFRVLGEIKKKELAERLEWLTTERKGAAPKPLLNNLK